MNRSAQLRVLALIAAGVALVAGVVITQRADQGIDILGRLGPTAGPDSTGHVRAQRAYLEQAAAAAPGRPAAGLVSMARLVTAAEASTLVDGMTPTAVFVRFPDSDPEVFLLTKTITETLETRAGELADAIRSEISGLEAQLRDASGGQRALLETSLTQRRRALEQTRPECACVYALGVEGATLAELAALARRAEVLLVDVPRPVVADLKGWELNPILPPDRSA